MDIESVNAHNNWNIVFLPIVFTMNIYLLLDWSTSFEMLFVAVFLIYLVLDFVWICVKPCCVMTPGIILMHHVVTIMGVTMIPYMDNELKSVICLASLVEINTWIRLVRNVVDNKYILNILFLVSWVIIRLIIGPMVHMMIYKRFVSDMSKMNLILLVTSIVLNGLTIMWTGQLVQKYMKKEI